MAVFKKQNNEFVYLSIPGFLLIGMGIGFLYHNLLPGLFIGLGAGLVMSGILGVFRK